MKILTSCFLIFASLIHAEVRLPAFFADKMVLQRDRPVPVWGWANAGEEVRVLFAGQDKTAKAGSDGTWRLVLEAMPANAVSQEMKIGIHVLIETRVIGRHQGQSSA